MGLSTVTTLTLGLLTAFPATFAADSSLYYKLRAKVTGPKTESTPKVDGWAIEVRKLGITTRIPPDWMWGVLYNPTFNCSISGCDPGRGGDAFYTQPSDGQSHVRTDAPNAQREVTPFGFYVQEGYDLVSDQMVAVRSNTAETVMDVAVEDGVPFLEKPGFDATFVACNETYREWAVVYWSDVGKYGADPIYNQDWRTCTEIQLVPECYSDGPGYEGLQETPCIADIATVL